MLRIIGTLITVASIAGLGVVIEGATDVRRRLLSYVHARRAKPSREGQTDEPEVIDNWEAFEKDTRDLYGLEDDDASNEDD